MKIDHTGYLVRDMEKALAQFEALGYTRDTDIIEDSATRNVALCFLHNGAVRIELVSPLHNGRPSVVDATLQRQGDGPYHICYRLEQPMEDALADLRRHDVRMAVVTSSNEQKMAAVYRHRPEIPALFDRILTAEHFRRSKPDPDCYQLGMRTLGTTPADTCVFEDSFNGLKAGMASGALVIGVATTNPREAIAPLSHRVIDDFRGFTYENLCDTLSNTNR